MFRSRSNRADLFTAVLAAIGVVTAAGCVSSGVLQGPKTLPPGSSATGIKLSRHGNAMSAALAYRMGLTE